MEGLPTYSNAVSLLHYITSAGCVSNSYLTDSRFLDQLLTGLQILKLFPISIRCKHAILIVAEMFLIVAGDQLSPATISHFIHQFCFALQEMFRCDFVVSFNLNAIISGNAATCFNF